MEFKEIILHSFYGFTFLLLIALVLVKRKVIWSAVIGTDSKLTLPEMAGMLWFFMIIVLFYASLMGVEAGQFIWDTVNNIFISIVISDGGVKAIKSVSEIVNKKDNKKENEDNA
jgi:hypothetical protein